MIGARYPGAKAPGIRVRVAAFLFFSRPADSDRYMVAYGSPRVVRSREHKTVKKGRSIKRYTVIVYIIADRYAA